MIIKMSVIIIFFVCIDYTPIRSGLRERKRVESPKLRTPTQSEKWVNEEKLELWEVKAFYEK